MTDLINTIDFIQLFGAWGVALILLTLWVVAERNEKKSEREINKELSQKSIEALTLANKLLDESKLDNKEIMKLLNDIKNGQGCKA